MDRRYSLNYMETYRRVGIANLLVTKLFSQMELRVQAHYTMLVGEGDLNLCRAFMPHKCTSIFDNKEFKYPEDDIFSGEWLDEQGDFWKETNLHDLTTMLAFPDLTKSHPHWEHYRKIGKACNFLKNYGGGTKAIMEQLGLEYETAKRLDDAYYEAFPRIRDYQKWVDSQLIKYGFVENLYKRRYYIQSTSNFYKAYNYVIQGGCADLVKEKEIAVHEFLKDKKSRMLLPVHDELQISVVKGEEWIVPEIKRIIDDNDLLVPLVCDIEVTHTNWAEKEDL